MIQQGFKTALKYSLGLLLLGWLLWSHWEPGHGQLGLKDALQRPVHYGSLGLALLLCLASLLLTFVRWYVLVQAQGLPLRLSEALRLGAIGYSLSILLPGSVGGDIMKAACLARQQSRRTVAVATVIFDRILGLCALFWLVALLGAGFWAAGLLDDAVLQTIIGGAWVLVGGTVLFWLVLGSIPNAWAEPWAERLSRSVPRLGPALAELWRALWLYRWRGRSLLLAMLLALIGHCGFVLSFYFAACTLSAGELIPSLAEHFLIVPVGMIIQAGFPAPGGLGGGEYGFGALYEWLGFTFTAGVLASLVQRAVTWMIALISYIIYLRMKPAQAAAPSQTQIALASLAAPAPRETQHSGR